MDRTESEARAIPSNAIAIIGMAGRFPGAKDVRTFWRNVRDGRESISHFDVDELEIRDKDRMSSDPRYIRARSILEDVDLFDAEFFGILPKEAERIDPQHRVFLENCWEAIEEAGYDPLTLPGAVAVYAGCSGNSYFLRNLCADPEFIEEYTTAYQIGEYQTLLGTLGDFLATRVSYKLNLKGPSFTIQSGCSTSLVAVAQACQSLLGFESDMALAGGVSITFPQKRGYLYQEGGMGSADGHCRSFDAEARGTVFGSGSGVIVLKRLEDAISDGDHIHAVILGTALNNDGATKAGYTAPSVEGQAQVIATAQALAGVDPGSIGYIEAHGTATPLGDPIEFEALSRAFGSSAKQRCVLGTVKRNVGHLDAASGVAGLINAVNILENEAIPPALHFKAPNSKIDLDNSPFHVNTLLQPWKRGDSIRRAGVSSFGVGGTNAHVVIEEAPALPSIEPRTGEQLLVLSARSEAALDEMASNLTRHLSEYPDLDLDSISYTLQAGRRAFDHRRYVVCNTVDDAIAKLGKIDRKKAGSTGRVEAAKVVFMFPGQGAQYANMGRDLYFGDSDFREDIDHCAELLVSHLGIDLRHALYPDDFGVTSEANLDETRYAQPALFVIGYALGRLWIRRGIKPDAMIGHSVGEFAAACLAGVFSLEEALRLVATRCRLMQDLSGGAMLSVRLGTEELAALFDDPMLAVAASNAPRLNVAAGPFEAIEKLEAELERRGIAAKRLGASHAFHSPMMDPILGPFLDAFEDVALREPSIPLVSCVSGTWMTAAEATDPTYWARHFRETVRFAEGFLALGSIGSAVCLEVGPGTTLCTLARQNREGFDALALPSLPSADDTSTAAGTMLEAAGMLWLRGITPDWREFHRPNPRRCSLPTYPFERKRHWIDPASRALVRPEPETVSVPSTAPTEVSMPVSNPGDSPVRNGRLRASLSELFEGLSGSKIGEQDYGSNFLEMGFDSLFLTQVSQSLRSKFELDITFRQLLDRESTIDTLADFIEQNRPISATPQPTPLPLSTPVAMLVSPSTNSSALAPTPGLESLFRDQIQAMSTLMANQLEVLRGGVTMPPTSAAPSPPVTPLSASSQPSGVPSKDFKAFGPYKPTQKGQTGELTTAQSQHLGALIARYTAKTAGSKQYTAKHRGVLADPRVASGFRSQWKEMVYPIVTTRSEGAYLWDIDGNRYIDILNGYGPVLFGYSPKFISDAIREQLDAGFEIGPQTPLAGEVAQLVSELTGMERVSFCNTGSEAVMAAIRVARTVTARDKIVYFAGDYHGAFDEVLSKSIRKGDGWSTLPIAPGIPAGSVGNVTVLPYGESESLAYIQAHARSIAAVIVEPVQSRHPGFQPAEFLKEIRAITESSGTALIFDEVVTGFRVHPGGAQAVFGIRADLATYGKVVGGGMPIGILAGSRRFMDALDGGAWEYGDDSYPEVGVTFFAGTFVRHPLALAATRAALIRMKAEGPKLQENLNEVTSRLVRQINRDLEDREVDIRLESFGSVFYFSVPTDQRFASLLYYHLREKGVHIQEGFPCYLTTAHSHDDLDHVARAFRESIDEMQRGGVLPAPSRGIASPVLPDVEIQIPITAAQMEIWVSARLGDDASCAYNETFTLCLRGDLDRQALEAAIQKLIGRHDALRCAFDTVLGIAKVAPRIYLAIPFVDLSSKSAGEAKSEVDAYLEMTASQPFDVQAGPLVRIALFGLGAEEHAMVFTSHHLVCDGWSTNVLMSELRTFYNASVAKVDAGLPAVALFADYARAEVVRRGSAAHEKVEAWWLKQFAEPVEPLDLPLDRPRGAMKSFRGETTRIVIDAGTTKALRRFGATQGCTLFATLLAGYKLLLSRLSGQLEIVVGIPAAGQSLLDNGNLVGHCVNFLPIRSKLDGDPSVGAFLKQVKATLLDATEHQEYTYGSLVRKLKGPRDPSRLPLVEVQFNLERLGGDLGFRGLEATIDPAPKQFVNFDLFFNIVESDAGMVLDCDFNRDLFDPETIGRWLGHYATLLAGMAADPKRPISAVPMLSDDERRQMLSVWNDTASPIHDPKCLHQRIAAQATKAPDSIAIRFEGESLTYAELERKAGALAARLRGLGVVPGTCVAICLNRSLELLTSLLAVLKAGGAYVPLDPDYPSDRIEAVIANSAPLILIADTEISGRINLKSTVALSLEEARMAMDQPDFIAPEDLATESDLAYLIFTSGSTGRPKGVELTHRSVVNLLGSMANVPGMTSADTILAVTTISFDIAVLELWLPLTVGATVEILPRETTLDGRELLKSITDSQATILQATPATWRLLLEAGWTKTPGLKALCGGEALPRDLAEAILDRAGSLWNMYGPTETTVWSSVLQIEHGIGSVPIGPPIANTTFHVLDGRREPQPIGVAGELYIGGEGLARGYRNRAELTAEKFVADPFDPTSGARLYATGDLVRRLADGSIEFLGRLDSQVKVRGFRIETGEVEQAMAAHPAVGECVVVADPDPAGEKRLVAYFTTASGPIPTASILRSFLADRLPGYMIPSLFQPIGELPKTPNGKVNRRALPKPVAPANGSRPSTQRELTGLERTLIAIAGAILRDDAIGVDDNLFDLGMDSIQVFQIVARVNEAGWELTPRQVLLNRTISAIGEALEAQRRLASDDDAPMLVPVSRDRYRLGAASLS